jgi:hypothetical protein
MPQRYVWPIKIVSPLTLAAFVAKANARLELAVLLMKSVGSKLMVNTVVMVHALNPFAQQVQTPWKTRIPAQNFINQLLVLVTHLQLLDVLICLTVWVYLLWASVVAVAVDIAPLMCLPAWQYVVMTLCAQQIPPHISLRVVHLSLCLHPFTDLNS